jgi:hypothetical protein
MFFKNFLNLSLKNISGQINLADFSLNRLQGSPSLGTPPVRLEWICLRLFSFFGNTFRLAATITNPFSLSQSNPDRIEFKTLENYLSLSENEGRHK